MTEPTQIKIPDVWLNEIDNNSEFGRRAAQAVARLSSERLQPSTPIIRSSRIGDHLHSIIKEQTGEEPCADCVDEIKKLNRMTVGEVIAQADAKAKAILERAQAKSQKWYHRAAATYLPSIVTYVVKDWIAEACERSNAEK
jgi:hypothetical protein